jgi:hypothetical protein
MNEAIDMDESTSQVCPHTNLVKQTGPMDGGAASTRYQCGVARSSFQDLLKDWRRSHYSGLRTEAENDVARMTYERCADELEAVLAKLEGCGAFFVVAPHEIGVSIGPPKKAGVHDEK